MGLHTSLDLEPPLISASAALRGQGHLQSLLSSSCFDGLEISVSPDFHMGEGRKKILSYKQSTNLVSFILETIISSIQTVRFRATGC